MPARLKTTNTRTGSTTWSWKTDKMRSSAGTANKSAPKARRWGGLSKRNGRDALTIRITYRGGNQAWYLVEARGRSGVFTGVRALHEVMEEINNVHGWAEGHKVEDR